MGMGQRFQNSPILTSASFHSSISIRAGQAQLEKKSSPFSKPKPSLALFLSL
jgi:hypothetical protein